MDWNNPPIWLIVLITLIIPAIIIILLMFLAWKRKPKPIIEACGIRFFLNDDDLKNHIKNVKKHIEIMIPRFIDGMSANGFFDKEELKEHIENIKCKMFTSELIANREIESKSTKKPIFTGLTRNPYSIEALCVKEYKTNNDRIVRFWDNKDQLKIYKTAFLYEILNACMWKIRGYTYAYAECFMNPDKKENWKWIDDLDEDGDKDGEDMRMAMFERKRFDERFHEVEKSIVDYIEKSS